MRSVKKILLANQFYEAGRSRSPIRRRRRHRPSQTRGGREDSSHAFVSGGAMYRLANPFVGSTAAEIAVHRLGDLLIRWFGSFREQRCGGQDLSRLTVAAL